MAHSDCFIGTTVGENVGEGVATATVCARFGFKCVIYMGEVDMERQALNVARMRFLGADVRAVTAGQRTLKEAVNEAMRDWVTNVATTHYILGSALGSPCRRASPSRAIELDLVPGAVSRVAPSPSAPHFARNYAPHRELQSC